MKKLLLFGAIALFLQSCKKEHCHEQGGQTKAKVTIALSLPEGCTSPNGYSTTNGQPCGTQSPPAGTIAVNNTASTNNVKFLAFTVKATNSNIILKKLPIQFLSTGAAVSSIIKTVKIYKGNDLVDSKSGVDCSAVTDGVINLPISGVGSTSCGYVFNNLNPLFDTVRMGTTVEYIVMVDLKPAQGNYPASSTLKAFFNNGDLLSGNFSALDQNGNVIPANPGHRIGEAAGEFQTLQVPSAFVVMGSSTYSNITDPQGNITEVTYNIPLTITNVQNTTLYIGQKLNVADVVSGTGNLAQSFAFVFQNSIAPAASVVNGTSISDLTSLDAVIENNGYRLDVGTTKHFVLKVVLVTPATPNSSYRVCLKQIRTFTDPMLNSNPINYDLNPAENYRTDYKFINN